MEFWYRKKHVTSIITIVKYAIKNWGYGQLNIKKQKNFMNKPTFSSILKKVKEF